MTPHNGILVINTPLEKVGFGNKQIHMSDMVIVVDEDTETFSIVKNRWGHSVNDLPISLLSKVLIKPRGHLDWN